MIITFICIAVSTIGSVVCSLICPAVTMMVQTVITSIGSTMELGGGQYNICAMITNMFAEVLQVCQELNV